MRDNSTVTEAPASVDGADFRGVLAVLLARKWLILCLTFLAFLGSLAFVNAVTPKYTAEARIILEYRDNYFTRPDKEAKGFEQPLDAEAVQSQVQAIMSNELAEKVIARLKLDHLEEFDAVRSGTGLVSRLLVLVGLGKDQLTISPRERVVERYFDKLLVFNVGKSRVIAVQFTSRDPKLAAEVANTIADIYIETLAEAKKSTTKSATNWLANAIEPMRQKVAEAEARVEAYRTQNGLFVGTQNASLATQQLGELSTQMSNARSAQADLQAKARMIRQAVQDGRIFETSEVVNNELIRRLLEQRVNLKTQIALEERTLLSGHPRMKELHAQLNDLESQIRTAAERTSRTFENDARVAGARLQSLQAELNKQKGAAASVNEAEVQLRALERDAKALRENYEQYLAKYRDAVARDTDAAAPADARVISRATPPQQPSFPKKLPIILLVTLATFVLSTAIFLTRALFAASVAESEHEVYAYEPGGSRDYAAEPAVYAPQLAEAPVHLHPAAPQYPMANAAAEVMPSFQPRSETPVSQKAWSPPSAEFQQAGPVAAPMMPPPVSSSSMSPSAPVAPVPPSSPEALPGVSPQMASALAPIINDLVLQQMSNGGQIVGVHAFTDDVLADATALPLARMLSVYGSTVLVDFAGAQNIDALLANDQAPGISDILAGACTFADAIHRDRHSRLHVIACGQVGYAPDEPDPDAPLFRRALEALSQSYTFVVFSAGPLGSAYDALLPIEQQVLMISSRDDRDPHVLRAIEEIEALGPMTVTLIVEDPVLVAPPPANDPDMSKPDVA